MLLVLIKVQYWYWLYPFLSPYLHNLMTLLSLHLASLCKQVLHVTQTNTIIEYVDIMLTSCWQGTEVVSHVTPLSYLLVNVRRNLGGELWPLQPPGCITVGRKVSTLTNKLRKYNKVTSWVKWSVTLSPLCVMKCCLTEYFFVWRRPWRCVSETVR